eukprot:TRINITY_DN14727_c0_g1_i3.p1 TRINITY_DN14727_c0_g1~~TRINITY_DN14727_c0_g1_i3.p1  ORF type:complete len:1977 (+),score=156.81 TRINITY_DN14727_c0_g1_i3:31-5931(+)
MEPPVNRTGFVSILLFALLMDSCYGAFDIFDFQRTFVQCTPHSPSSATVACTIRRIDSAMQPAPLAPSALPFSVAVACGPTCQFSVSAHPSGVAVTFTPTNLGTTSVTISMAFALVSKSSPKFGFPLSATTSILSVNATHAVLARTATTLVSLCSFGLTGPNCNQCASGFRPKAAVQKHYISLLGIDHAAVLSAARRRVLQSTVTVTHTITSSSTLPVTRTSSRTASPTRTSATYTRTPSSSRTPTMSRTRTPTRSATATKTRSPTLSRTRTASRTPTTSRTRTATATRSKSPSRSWTETPDPSRTNTLTATGTRSRTISRTTSYTTTRSLSHTRSTSGSSTRSPTHTRSVTESRTSTVTVTRSSTLTPSATQQATSSFTRSQTATTTRSVTFSRTRTHSRSETVTISRSLTSTRTVVPTFTSTPTATETDTPTMTTVPTKSNTLTVTLPSTATFTPIPTLTPTRSRTPTVAPTATPMPTQTRTATLSQTTLSATETTSTTPTLIPTLTAADTRSPTPSVTETPIPTATPSRSATPTPTVTATPMPSATPKATLTSTRSPTQSRTDTTVPTRTASTSNTKTLTPQPTPLYASACEREPLQSLIDFHTNNGPADWPKSNWRTTDNPCDWFGVWCHDNHLAALTLGGNGMVGPGITSAFLHGGYTVEYLDLSSNKLRGDLGIVARLPLLFDLRMQRNNISDKNLPDFSHSVFLRSVNLHENRISGQLDVKKFSPVLTELRLDSNAVRGSIPKSFGSAHIVSLAKNNLEGAFPSPSTLCSPDLEVLKLSFNQLSGTIPNNIEPCHGKSIYLNGNKFTGKIPRVLTYESSDDEAAQPLLLAENPWDCPIPDDRFWTDKSQTQCKAEVLSAEVLPTSLTRSHFIAGVPAALRLDILIILQDTDTIPDLAVALFPKDYVSELSYVVPLFNDRGSCCHNQCGLKSAFSHPDSNNHTVSLSFVPTKIGVFSGLQLEITGANVLPTRFNLSVVNVTSVPLIDSATTSLLPITNSTEVVVQGKGIISSTFGTEPLTRPPQCRVVHHAVELPGTNSSLNPECPLRIDYDPILTGFLLLPAEITADGWLTCYFFNLSVPLRGPSYLEISVDGYFWSSCLLQANGGRHPFRVVGPPSNISWLGSQPLTVYSGQSVPQVELVLLDDVMNQVDTEFPPKTHIVTASLLREMRITSSTWLGLFPNYTAQLQGDLAQFSTGRFVFSTLLLPDPPTGEYALQFAWRSLSVTVPLKVVPNLYPTRLREVQPPGRVTTNSGDVIPRPGFEIMDAAFNSVDRELPGWYVRASVSPARYKGKDVTATMGGNEIPIDASGRVQFNALSVQGAHGVPYTLIFEIVSPAGNVTASLSYPLEMGSCLGKTYAAYLTKTCEPCPTHATCTGNMQLSLDSGFWRPVELPYPADIHKCSFEGICFGGLRAECRTGHTGPLCGICKEGYGMALKGTCDECPSRALQITFLVFTLLATAIGVVILVRLSVKDSIATIQDEQLGITKGKTHRVAPFVKQYVTHLQASVAVGNIPAGWPKIAGIMFLIQNAFANLDLHAASLNCAARLNYYQTMILYLSINFFALFLVAAVLFLTRSAQRTPTSRRFRQNADAEAVMMEMERIEDRKEDGGEQSGKNVYSNPWDSIRSKKRVNFQKANFIPEADEDVLRAKSISNHLVVGSVVAVFLLYPSLMQQLAKGFRCTEEINKHRYLVFDVSIECAGPQYVFFRTLCTIFSLSYGILVPVTAVIVLRINIRWLQDTIFFTRYGFLYKGYRPHAWWWEAVLLVRKAMLSFIVVISSSPTHELTFMMWTFSAELLLTFYFAPFVGVGQHIQMLSLITSVVKLSLGYIYHIAAPTAFVTWALYVILFFLEGITLLCFMVNIFKGLRRYVSIILNRSSAARKQRAFQQTEKLSSRELNKMYGPSRRKHSDDSSDEEFMSGSEEGGEDDSAARRARSGSFGSASDYGDDAENNDLKGSI